MPSKILKFINLYLFIFIFIFKLIFTYTLAATVINNLSIAHRVSKLSEYFISNDE